MSEYVLASDRAFYTMIATLVFSWLLIHIFRPVIEGGIEE